MIKFRMLGLVMLLLAWAGRGSAQYVHTEHKQIVDAAGRPILVRATNLGNWMVPEGYMWLFEGGPQSASEIRELVLELLGPEGSAAFWQKWRENYVTREDIALLRRAGFNTIRVPLHYSLFESDDAEGFRLLDWLIEWSRAENLYVILDLHAAPGGQTGTNIDDSAGYPWLYQSPQEQEHLVAIWRRLATHYRDEQAVLGYDLLNEPIPHFPKLAPLNPSLEPLYKKVTAEIRKVDGHHILFLGGAQWDSNFSVFGKPFDANVAYTLHKYWTAPDESVLREYIDFRERYDVPIWLGESGENTDEWIAPFVKALEKNNIGWAFWPYKKLGKPSAVVSIVPPAEWEKIVEFAKLPRGTGHAEERLKARPEQETINRVFADLLESVRVQKCRVNEGYLKALGLKADVAQTPTAKLLSNDAVRIHEFYRLSAQIQDEVWAGWSGTSAPLLLVTKDTEFLTHHPSPPKDFQKIADDQYARPRQFPTSLLATFPAFGPPSVIVIGEPENTEAKTSTPWLFIVMHEHFHQLQDDKPGFYEAVNGLGLTHGDNTGMWMLNYPFPYDNAELGKSFAQLRDLLLTVLNEPDGKKFKVPARQYIIARKAFFAQLSPDDRKYLSLQLWKEGIARYVQIKSAEAAANYQRTAEYAALPDYQPFGSYAREARSDTLSELKKAELATWKRVVVYSFGACEGLLLDRLHPKWKQSYFQQLFTLDPYFEKEP